MAIHRFQSSQIPDGLTEKTKEIFSEVTKLECIKELALCGGTAQSIQMNHRLSEDLDFELIGIKKERPQLDFNGIITEISDKFRGAKTELLGEDHFHVFINDGSVKLSFFRPENPVKSFNKGYVMNNLKTPNLQELLGMKLYTVCVRTKFRDYYDIYCLLDSGCKLKDAIDYASYLSRHMIRSKTMLARLLSPKLFPKDADFERMKPKYDLSPEQIMEKCKSAIINENIGAKIKNTIPRW